MTKEEILRELVRLSSEGDPPRDGEVTASEFAKSHPKKISRGAALKILHRMEKKGLVKGRKAHGKWLWTLLTSEK